MRLHSGTVTRPRFETRPYRPSPARREAIHGRIVPLHPEPICGLQRASTIGSLILVAMIVALFVGQFIFHAASDARPLASGSTAAPSDAGSSPHA